jgi:hypothetical protein
MVRREVEFTPHHHCWIVTRLCRESIVSLVVTCAADLLALQILPGYLAQVCKSFFDRSAVANRADLVTVPNVAIALFLDHALGIAQHALLSSHWPSCRTAVRRPSSQLHSKLRYLAASSQDFAPRQDACHETQKVENHGRQQVGISRQARCPSLKHRP